MADTKISALAISPAQPTDLIPIARSGANYSVTVASILAGASSTPAIKWYGAWNALATYGLNNVVTFNGSAYLSLVAFNSTVQPGTNNAIWLLLNSGQPSDSEVPSGAIDGTNQTFTFAHTPLTGSMKPYKNGMRLLLGTDFTISGAAITMISAMAKMNTGDTIIGDYRY